MMMEADNEKAVPERPSLAVKDEDVHDLAEQMNSLRFTLRSCAVCKKEGHKKCSGCKRVAYCCKEHQAEDWNNHKEKCRLYSVKKDSQSGQTSLIAAKDLEAGTIIILEKPLFQFPEAIRPEFLQKVTVSWCLSCGVYMNKILSQTPKCTICGWPICSSECQKLPIHKDNECKFFSSKKIKYEENVLKDIWAIIATVRGMTMKQNEPKKWEEILSLGLQDQTVVGAFALGRMGSDLGECFRTCFHPVELHEILMNGAKMCGLTMIKGLFNRTQDQFQSETKRSGYYLYSTASHIRHSCSPNTYWKIGHAPDFELQVRVMVPVKKGEEITLSRIQYLTEMRRGTYERQVSLRTFFSQRCECPRCLDPTELGSFMSAIKCPNCRLFEEKEKEKAEREKERNEAAAATENKNKNTILLSSTESKSKSGGGGADLNSGYLLYTKPSDWFPSDQTITKCNKCGSESPLSKYQRSMFNLVDALDKFETSGFMKPGNTENILKLCHGLIENYSGKILHPNHFAVFRARQFLITRELANLENMTMTKLEEYIENCYYVLDVLGKINPGFSCFQGNMIFHLIRALKRKCALIFPSCSNSPERVSEYMGLLSKIIELNEQAIFFYKDELPYGRDQVVNEWYKGFVAFMQEAKKLREEASRRFE